jgi:hypothetical protein
MKKFWLGVLVGALGMAIICAAIPFAFSVFAGPRTVAAFQRGDQPAQPPIVFRGLFASRGEIGSVDEIGEGTFKFTTRDGEQKTIILSAETAIYRGRTKISASELSKGQRLLVIGTPQDSSSILAKLIRFVTYSFGNPGIPNESKFEN